ncbi:hypothetical protein LJR030_002864 [Rhizobium sp. LjRoot30]|uniref:hypothetical protein n=1 Tax=Rhizobium sp. LjRoot30 TaxID=3342320 RepID=UPI003ED0792F
MRVLSFPSFSKNRTPAKGQDWSQQEIADFYRAHRLLVENGAGIGIDRGLTDVEEPWLIFYDLTTQDVFMHVARIDNRCILICETLGIRLKASTIAELIVNFESAVREHLAVRTERNSNVVLHPAAKIIMSISAIFLLFKLDNGGVAYAKDMGVAGEKIASPEVVKKSDPTLLLRAQSALGRLFETVDSPRAVASLAGAILTGEILINLHAAQQQHQQETASLSSEKLVALLPEASKIAVHDDTAENARVEHAVHSATMQETEANRTMAPVVIAAEEIQLKHAFEEGFAGEVLRIAVAPVQNQVSEPAIASLGQMAISQGEAVTDKVEKGNTNTAVLATPESIKTLQDLLGQNFQVLTKGETLTVSPSQVDKGDILPGSGIGIQPLDISLSSLDDLDTSIGFYMQTTLGNAEVMNMLQHFMNNMGRYEVEYSGGKVLIEQDHMADLSSGDIGLWTNVMSDGSTISVVGQADLIDDIAMLFS